MPDVDIDNARRGGRLPTVLFWAGVGLAPLAGLLLLLGSGNGVLRVAAILTVLAVGSIGLSIALRPDPATVRLQMEETLLEEIDMLRADVRNDIATAARATHQSFGERLQSVQQAVDALRAERAGYDAHGHAAVAHAVAPLPVASSEPAPAARPPVAAPTHGRASVDPATIRARHQPDGHRPVPAGRANVPAGVFRHTETVQVTTRSTYVDDHGHNGDRARASDAGYGGGQVGNGRRDRPPSRDRAPEPHEESWTDQKLRERYGYGPSPDDRARGREADRSGDRGDDRWGDSGQWRTVTPEAPVPGRAGRWDDPAPPPGLRAGERWAAVRTDERGGRELEMGERRAARHADGSGTQWRVEDRWAAVRRDDDLPAADRGVPDFGRRALPAAGGEPSWNDGGDEPVREPRGHGYRGDDSGDAGGRSHRLDFELSDERWR